MRVFDFSQNFWQFIVMALVSYLIGCFNFARIIAKHKHKDITKIGSGNPGTMNMSREFGWKIGALTFVLDAVKGGIVVLAGHLLYQGYVFSGTQISVTDVARYFCGVFAVLGHIVPITAKFKGGKGIATAFGVFWVGLSCEKGWYAAVVLGMLIGVLLFIYFTEWGSLGNLVGTAAFCIFQTVIFIFRYQLNTVSAYMVWMYMQIFVFMLMTWLAHHGNVVRLLSGEEHRTSLKKIVQKKNKE